MIAEQATTVRPWGHLVALSLLLGLLNCIKPMHIDDPFFYAHAEQAARAPLDPYGFDILWFQHPQPALSYPTPPVLGYYLAPAVAWFGEQTWLIKLSLFPFAFILVVAFDALLRRFAPRYATALLWLITLSPVVLPSFNLMLDVPSLALSLASLACFARAVDLQSWRMTIVAGLLAGLASQTKYTGLTAPVAILFYGIVFQQFRLSLCAAVVAALVFVGFEGFTLSIYGESRFLAALENNGTPWKAKLKLLTALVRTLGMAHAAGAVLGLFVLGQTARRAAWLAIVLMATFLGLVVLPTSLSNQVANLVFGFAGLVLIGAILVVALRHCAPPWSLQAWRANWHSQRSDWFLLAWLMLELASYAVLSPFSAVRRVLGLFVVGTIILGRGISACDTVKLTRRHVHLACAASVLLGLLFQLVDWHEANAVRVAVLQADRAIHLSKSQARPTVWYVGHWGFIYYAQQAGWQQIVPGESQLRPGDWLVRPTERLGQQQIVYDAAWLNHEQRVTIADRIPLRTMANYFAGSRPLEGHDGERLAVDLYQVRQGFVAQEPVGYESLAYGARPKQRSRQ